MLVFVLPALLPLLPPLCWHSVPPKQVGCAQVPPLLAPLSPPASSSSTHTHNTQVPVSSMPRPTARATIPRFARALFAASASPSTPAAGTQCAAARIPSALEGLLTRATHRHPLLCVLAALRERRSASLLALCLLCGPSGTCFHPHSTVQTSLVPVRHRTINISLFFCFVFRDALAAHAVH